MSYIDVLSLSPPQFPRAPSVIIHNIPVATEWTPPLLAVINNLPEKQRLVIQVKYSLPGGQELSMAELTRRMGLTNNNVLRLYHKANLKLLHEGFNLNMIANLIGSNRPRKSPAMSQTQTNWFNRTYRYSSQNLGEFSTYSTDELNEILGKPGELFGLIKPGVFNTLSLRFGLNHQNQRLSQNQTSAILNLTPKAVSEYEKYGQSFLGSHGLFFRQKLPSSLSKLGLVS